jgi:hypothetical protein
MRRARRPCLGDETGCAGDAPGTRADRRRSDLRGHGPVGETPPMV